MQKGLARKPLCRNWKNTGSCSYGDQCKFAHSRPPQGLRRQWLMEKDHHFKVICWNLLADSLVDYSHYPTAPKRILHWNHREKIILQHLQEEAAADVLCLQEVDARHFEGSLLPAFRAQGFQGVFKKRTGDKYDGCAIFYRMSCFTPVQHFPMEFHDPNDPLLDRDNIALAVVLKHVATGKDLVICTTHILFNPKRGDVKLAQVVRMTKALSEIRTGFGGVKCPLIICGDFNSTPSSAVYELLTKGELRNGCSLDRRHVSGQDHVMWKLAKFGPGSVKYSRSGSHRESGSFIGQFLHPAKDSNDSEVLESASVTNDTGQRKRGRKKKNDGHFLLPPRLESLDTELGPLRSAYSLKPTANSTDEPAFTTYHHSFKGTVDYIFYSSSTDLEVASVLGMPKPHEFSRGLPSVVWPSDHLSLVASFVFADSKSSSTEAQPLQEVGME